MNIPFYSLKHALDFASNPDIENVFPERKKHKSQIAKLKFDMINAFILRAPEYYKDIVDIYQEFPFHLMIADITFGAIPFVKEKMNIPVIGVGIVPLVETSRDLPPAGLGLTPSDSIAGRIQQTILRFVADKLIFAKPTKVMTRILNACGIDTGNANIFDILIQKSTVVLQSGTPGFEYRRSDISKHIVFTGPLLPLSKKKESQRWYDEKLKQYSKVILVTQGTVETDADKLLTPTLEAFKNSDILVIVTTGGSKTESLREKYPQKNIIIEDFIAFDDVMPYADVYITNGGYGGVLLSIQNELPMVVAGIHEGKNEINARVGYFELGINLKTEKPSPIQVKKAVYEVLTNDTYLRNVRQLNNEFRQYRPADILENTIKTLVKRPSKQKPKREPQFDLPIY